MDLLSEIKALCDLYHIKPSRSKGQNFLVSQKIYDQIVAAADLSKSDVVLEVGPGLGFLSLALAPRVHKVLCVELDDRIAAILPDRFKSQSVDNIKVVNADIRQLNLSKQGREFGSGAFHIVANLPYNISSFFLRQFLSGPIRPQTMTLMLQDEVAKRLTARPGDMSLLALSASYYSESEYLFQVSSKHFWPEPKVQSAVVRMKLKPNSQLPLSSADEKLFWRLAKHGFSAKRKMLKNNLQSGLKIDSSIIRQAITKIGISEKVRAEDLALDDWLRLLGYLRQYML